ncbi:MAG: TIGR00725 family protein [Candidatus Marinimicrobia bacterium]|nr:TIGR00725 family protein [Candidatus Neomarinimicrobiota bacterium]
MVRPEWAEKKRIAVFGGRVSTERLLNEAYKIGQLVAERGALLYCGGMSGVMEEAARGAVEHDGEVVGILPTADVESANPYITIPVVTGIGTARNSIIARSVNGGIAINGRYGTLSEIAYSLDFGVPIVGLDTWEIEGVVSAASAEDAITQLWENW